MDEEKKEAVHAVRKVVLKRKPIIKAEAKLAVKAEEEPKKEAIPIAQEEPKAEAKELIQEEAPKKKKPGRKPKNKKASEVEQPSLGLDVPAENVAEKPVEPVAQLSLHSQLSRYRQLIQHSQLSLCNQLRVPKRRQRANLLPSQLSPIIKKIETLITNKSSKRIIKISKRIRKTEKIDAILIRIKTSVTTIRRRA